MNETVTVDEAISRGHRMVTIPIVIIIIGIGGIAIYLATQKLISGLSTIFSMFFFFGLAWLWNIFMIKKWKFWAFENVRNVHELKKRAIQEKLISDSYNIFEKYKPRNEAEKEKLHLLQNKFKQDDLFQDDSTVPSETIIYYSKMGNFIDMIIMLFFAGSGIYLIAEEGQYTIGLVFTLFFSYRSFKEYQQATNPEPQIILNEKGIKTITTDFYSWDEIEDEEVVSKGTGKNIRYYLTYYHPKGVEYLQIDDYETNQRDLNKLLIVYRGRSKKKKTSR